MCGLISSDIFHLAESQETQCGQELRLSGVCEKPFYFRVNLHQHQKPHIGEKPLRSDVRRALVVSSCKFYVSMKPFTLGNIGKDFLGNSGFLHQEATHTWQKSHSETEYEAPFLRGKNHYNWGDYTKTLSGKHAVVQHQRVLTRERCYVCTECGKSFSKTPISLDIRAFTLEKGLMSATNVANLLAKAQTSFSIREFTLEKGLMSAVNVGKPLSKDHISFSTRVFTLEKGLKSVKNVGNLLAKATASFTIRVFILGKDLMNVVNVGNHFPKTLCSFNIRGFTLEKVLMSAANVGNLFGKALHSFSIREFIVEKGLTNVVNVGNPLDISNLITHQRFHTGEMAYDCS